MDDTNGTGEVRSGPKFMAKADMEKKLPKRFYTDVNIEGTEGGFLIQLDGRTVKTPAKDQLKVPMEPLALAIAEEWRAQEEHINPETMLLTKLANTALDRVRGREADIVQEVVSYLSTDLLCYRSGSPRELSERQADIWNPILKVVEDELDIGLKAVSGILHVEQPEISIENAREHLGGYDIFALGAFHNMTTLLGSAVLTLAHANRFIDMQEVWRAAHVDEDWQVEHWGKDEEASARREARFQEMQSTSRFFDLSRSTD